MVDRLDVVAVGNVLPQIVPARTGKNGVMTPI
jgi:hypothetical protein